jgi:hypothetical protein
MAPLTPIFEFAFHESAVSLELPLGKTAAGLEALADMCDLGDNYERVVLRVRRRWRQIAIPERDLDSVQRRIGALLFPLDLTIGEHAHGYVARRSIKTNAAVHVGARHLQKFDIKEFFSNINAEMISSKLRSAGFGDGAAQLLSRLTTCRGSLPLGARTSPRISNLVLWDFDDRMAEVAAEQGLRYSRYADDLSFSGTLPFDVEDEVEASLSLLGFSLNPAKTKLFKHGQPMFVTGLSVSDELFPRLRKRQKSRLRAEFFYVEKYGVDGHAETVGEDPNHAAARIMGQYHYARSIEPLFARRLETGYPSAFKALIPLRFDDRIERAERYRQEFLNEVASAPAASLPFYTPSVRLGSS